MFCTAVLTIEEIPALRYCVRHKLAKLRILGFWKQFDFYVTHCFACTQQKTIRVGKTCPVIEPKIYVLGEYAYIKLVLGHFFGAKSIAGYALFGPDNLKGVLLKFNQGIPKCAAD